MSNGRQGKRISARRHGQRLDLGVGGGANDGTSRDKFLSLVSDVFEGNGRIVEKYDVVRRSSDVNAALRFGYSSNEIGFGWTNGVFLELLGLKRSLP